MIHLWNDELFKKDGFYFHMFRFFHGIWKTQPKQPLGSHANCSQREAALLIRFWLLKYDILVRQERLATEFQTISVLVSH